MGTTTLVWRADDYPPLRWPEADRLADHWLGRRVSFKLCGHPMIGEVVETERVHLCNGEHDILTVEIEGDRKQVKVQLHRQACTIIEDERDG